MFWRILQQNPSLIKIAVPVDMLWLSEFRSMGDDLMEIIQIVRYDMSKYAYLKREWKQSHFLMGKIIGKIKKNI